MFISVSGGTRRSYLGEWGLGAFDATPDSGGQSVLKTFEMAIRHNRAADTNGIREIFLSLDLFSLKYKNMFMALLEGGGSMEPPLTLPMRHSNDEAVNSERG